MVFDTYSGQRGHQPKPSIYYGSQRRLRYAADPARLLDYGHKVKNLKGPAVHASSWLTCEGTAPYDYNSRAAQSPLLGPGSVAHSVPYG